MGLISDRIYELFSGCSEAAMPNFAVPSNQLLEDTINSCIRDDLHLAFWSAIPFSVRHHSFMLCVYICCYACLNQGSLKQLNIPFSLNSLRDRVALQRHTCFHMCRIQLPRAQTLAVLLVDASQTVY